jgi:hypothetical protein
MYSTGKKNGRKSNFVFYPGKHKSNITASFRFIAQDKQKQIVLLALVE